METKSISLLYVAIKRKFLPEWEFSQSRTRDYITVLWQWNLFLKWLYEVNKINVYLLTVLYDLAPLTVVRFSILGFTKSGNDWDCRLIYAAKVVFNNWPLVLCLFFTLLYFILFSFKRMRNDHHSHEAIKKYIIYRRNTLFFLYKNIFYKNIETEICQILRIF